MYIVRQREIDRLSHSRRARRARSVTKENIMRKGKLTRELAIQEAGLGVVEKLEHENCDFSGRLQTDGDDAVEFTASIAFVNSDGDNCHLVAYYYQMAEDVNERELDQLDWKIEGYEIC